MFKDNHGLITRNQYGNTESDSFKQTVDLYFIAKKEKAFEIAPVLRKSIDSALTKMDCGNGIYKNHPEYPHPRMDRNKHRRPLDKKVLSSIIDFYIETKQDNKLKEIQRATQYGMRYTNTGNNKARFMSITDIIYLFYFYLMTLIRLK